MTRDSGFTRRGVLQAGAVAAAGALAPEAAETAIKSQVELLKDNKNLVGYFIDNELDWGDGFSCPATYFDFRPAKTQYCISSR